MGRRGLAGLLAAALLAVSCAPSASAPGGVRPQPASPIVFEGGTTAATARPSLTLEIARPPAAVAGHVLVAQVAARHRAAPTVLKPDGWTQVGVTSAAGRMTAWIFLRVADGSESDAFVFGATVPTSMAGTISEFSRVDTANPVDTVAGTVNARSAVLNGPPVSTKSGNAVALWLGTQLSEAKSCPERAITPPPGFRAAVDDCSRGGSGVAIGSAVRQLGAGSVQPPWDGKSAVTADSVVQVVALRPVGSGNGDGRPPRAQVADRFAPEPALSLTGPGRFGYVLWKGLGADRKPVTDIGPDTLYQPSGLAPSRTDPSILFANSEKDRGTMVAISTRDGEIVGRYSVQIPNLFDWEDIAAGPCPGPSSTSESADDCLFAADIGGNRGESKPGNVFSITRFVEPDVAGGQTSGELGGDTFPYTYPGGIVVNAEAVMVDPWTGAIYVITKSPSGVSDVYTFPTPLPSPGVSSELVKIGTLRLTTTAGDPEAAQVTAAAIHPVANRFLVRTYRHVFEFRGPEGGSFLDALNGERVELTDPAESQGESITYAIDGSAYFTLSEATKSPYRLNRVDRI